MNIKQLLVLTIGLVLYTNFASAALITNGSMNHPTADTGTFNALAPTGWSQDPLSVDVFDANSNFFTFLNWVPSTDGGTFLHAIGDTVNGFNEGASQSISGLSIGQTYELTFEQATSSTKSGFWQVSFGTEVFNTATMAAVNSNVWDVQSLLFTATSNTQLLSFIAMTNEFGRVDLGIDGVSLELAAIPLPGALWLFGSGIALFGMTRRRRT
ncbi:hypothetical protein MNBD_GAMMA06-1578 [hydrothermal vent metagenome]|uniref:DUF642 domain-containing protein n=1 Tax=hydrothermal vent metagenome TaxID=652676 RepID=A0A3B0W3M8_9ZZZZ